MDKKRSILNISVSIVTRVILIVSALIVRRLLIQKIGNEVNGLNSLFASIIGMMAVAELGVGSAIVYSMYKPIVEGDKTKVAALYGLYVRLYRIIGAFIFVGGMMVMPFLPRLIKDYNGITVNIYYSFFLTLVSVVLSYLYSAKGSLIEAYKDNYITTTILAFSTFIRHILQLIAIMIWASYTVYLICQIISTLITWIMMDAMVQKKHSDIMAIEASVSPETKDEVVKNTKAMFIHKIGGILVNSIDSLVISCFIGVAVLGKFSNYTYIATVMFGTITLFFSPVTSVVGHLCAGDDPLVSKKYFDYFYCLNYVLGVICFLGYYAVIDDVVRLCFGDGLEVSRVVSFIITVYYFMAYMRKTTLLFRDASGTFYHDRWRPLLEAVANLILSTLLVNILPEDYRVAGVIVATIIILLTIIFIIEPYYVFKYTFRQSPVGFYIRNYGYIVVFILSLKAMEFLMTDQGMIVNGCISMIWALLILTIVAIADKQFRHEIIGMGKWMGEKISVNLLQLK